MSHANHPMSCREMAEYLSDYLDGEIEADLRSLIDDHRGDCPPCDAFIRTLKRTVEMVRARPRVTLSAARRKALARALRRAGGSSRERSLPARR